jgi:hypothetical protein
MAGSTVPARVSHSCAVAVAVVHSFFADLPVFGAAEGVGLRGHECVGERFEPAAQQIGTRRSEVLLREGMGQTRVLIRDRRCYQTPDDRDGMTNTMGKSVTPRTLQVSGECEAAIGHFEQCQLVNVAALPHSADSGGWRSSVEVS